MGIISPPRQGTEAFIILATTAANGSLINVSELLIITQNVFRAVPVSVYMAQFFDNDIHIDFEITG